MFQQSIKIISYFCYYSSIRIYVYDFSMKMKWKGEIAPVEAIDDKIEATGTLELIDVMVDDDDYQVSKNILLFIPFFLFELKLTFKQKIVVDNEDKSKYPIKDTIKKLINKKVADILASLVEEARGI